MPVQAVRRAPISPTASQPGHANLATMPDNPLHPMHQALVARWTERPAAHSDKLMLPARTMIALVSAASAWAGLIALVRLLI
jgi:hypothetical protein